MGLQARTHNETVASIKISIFIYSGVFVKPQNIQTQTEHTKAYTRPGTPLSIQVLSSTWSKLHPACSVCPSLHETMRCPLSKATWVQLKGNWTPPTGWGNPDPTI